MSIGIGKGDVNSNNDNDGDGQDGEMAIVMVRWCDSGGKGRELL